MINHQRVMREFFELVQIDSPTREERTLADHLKKKLRELNCEVIEDQAGEVIGGNCGNIFANLAGNIPDAPCVMLSAHMDTVEPGRGIKPCLKDGVITSEGNTILGADDKAGIVPILEALRVIQEQNLLHGDIQIVFCVAEEGGLNGSKNLDQSFLKGDLGFVLDSEGRPGTITIQAPGQDSLKIEIEGKAAHAGISPEKGVSAIIVAAKAIAQMKLGRIDEETTANIGTLQGGIATNIIPQFMSILGEARSHTLTKLEDQSKHMVECFEQQAQELGANVTSQVTRSYNAFHLSQDSQVVKLAAKGANVLGLEVNFTSTGGGSDANYFNQYGIPSAVLGIGIESFHTIDECIKEEDLYLTTEWLLEILKGASKEKRNLS